MNRKYLVCFALMSVGLASPVFSSDQLNIIHVMADDMGWGDLACYGSEFAKTPNLDRMAKEGTLFTQYYSAASVCSPSRISTMTGRFPGELGHHTVTWWPDHWKSKGNCLSMDPTLPNVARTLKEAGYHTAHFGKWHMGGHQDNNAPDIVKAAPPPEAYGFDVSHTDLSTGEGMHYPPEAMQSKKFRAYSSQVIVDYAIQFLKDNPDEPVYMNVWFKQPHSTVDPTEEQLNVYKKLFPVGQNSGYKGANAVYYSCITDIDTHIGRLLDYLRQTGRDKNTLVIFTSDNGPEEISIRNASHSGVGSSGPFRGRKRSLYEGGTRDPFIVWMPGTVPAGKVSDTVLSSTDWYPSVCHLAGVKIPAGTKLSGTDASKAYLGESWERSTPLFWQWRYPIIGHAVNQSPIGAMRDGSWKLLMNPDDSRIELYDINSDPYESMNLATQNPEVVERMKKQLMAWQATLPEGPIFDGAGRRDYPWPQAKK